MYNTSFIKKILIVATVVLLYSCDKDFNAIGDDLIGDNHFGLTPENYDVLAYNQEVTPIQSNGLPINALGIYDNPVFGTTTANYNTQVALSEYAPTIGDAPEIESVVLSVPYFSHITAADPKGGSVYALDSIFGDPKGKIKLSVYESGVQTRASYFDTGNQLAQLYYTDENANFDNFKKTLLNDGKASENTEFFFDAAQKIDSTVDATTKKVTVTYSAPEMRLHLNNAFFQAKILNAPASKLSSADVFQEYFRGLYFKVEKSGSNTSNMALIDFAKSGKVTIKYKARTAITTDPEATMEDKTLVLTLTGSTVNLLQDAKNAVYDNAIKNPNVTEGDDRLYLKGGQGSVAVIDLFDKTDLIGYNSDGVLQNAPNGVSDALDEIRNNVTTKKWLVNEANLVFYIDSDNMSKADPVTKLLADEPKRVYLYDLTNNLPLIDYSDGTSGVLTPTDPKSTKYVFGGIIDIDATTKRGKTYKVRITNHVRNLVKDATAVNVKLGLAVTQDISIIASNKLKAKNSVISEAPRGSVISPAGTILYGGKSSAGDKKLKLEIYYTKPN
ncbi:DUF4270 domain-containing protein [Flavobacterium sp. MR2016-29]|uniref:DUF4270 domain-containing protein n=1 Tax=Flavobacterium sp. MR2016-29 TaxID=2783795 RepID=UPI00188A0E6D|nr:DUF4270 domain-containing protein [Flavobacterium sp. MR2016-29]MBF4492604.1 DUF4270 domain-containing protein [Flavobacterium sp. MR2016-29]